MKLTKEKLEQLIMEAMNSNLNTTVDDLLSGNKKRVLQAATALQDAGHILSRDYNGPNDIAFSFDRDTMTQKREMEVYEMVRQRYNEMGSRGEAQYIFDDSYNRLDIVFPGAHPDF
jgi:hypothetical protein